MSATDYGSVSEDANKKKEGKAPYEQGRAWEQRGTILGLLIDVGGATVSQAMMLIPMVSNSLTSDSTFMACNEKLHPIMKSTFLLCLCEYLTAFAMAFPVLAVTATMLIIGRNLLQKRFYYAMLQSGGVVTFGQNDVFKEVIFWIIVLSYLHCIGYVCFLIYVLQEEGKFSVDGRGIHAAEQEMLMIVSVISLLIIPGGLFTAFFFTAYDVEGTLVPLSQYVHDAEDMQKKFQFNDSFQNLKVMDDRFAQAVLTEQGDEILRDEGTYEEKCGMVLDVYRREEDALQGREFGTLGLFSSFWPGQLLLKPAVKGEAGRYFKLLWFSVVSVFLIFFACLICFLITSIYYEILGLLHGSLAVIPSMVVLALHLIVVTGFLWPFLESLTWRWARSPLSKVVHAGISARSEGAKKPTGDPDTEK